MTDVRSELEALRADDLVGTDGQALAYVYGSGDAEVDRIATEALSMYSSANGLDPTVFPSLMAMENHLVAFVRPLLEGPDSMVGSVTSGGTESIMLAMLAAREARPEVDRPVVLLPDSVHAAFRKAAHYLRVEPVSVEVDPVTRRASVAAMAEALETYGDRVVMAAASAPSYAHGVIDPIEELAGLAAARGVRFHVDACIGGWVLPFTDREVPLWNFSVPGVTSISSDLHKYAYGAKGASMVLHRTPEHRRTHFFSTAEWPGYTMVNATMQSTKSGGPLAAAYAVVRHLGVEGYRESVARTLDAVDRIAEAVRAEPHLRLAADPEATAIAIETDESCDVFTLVDLMADRGWLVQPQMAFRGMPASVHLTVSGVTVHRVDDFIAALSDATAEAVSQGPIQVDPGLVEVAASLDPATLDDAAFDMLLEIAGLASEGGELGLPDRMGQVNALLNASPPALREALLIAFFDRLYRGH